MTQVELAGGRFSKEYISQIERGKTRPTQATVAWLAERLGVDQGFLSVGVSTEDRTKVEALLARAEALSEAHRYSEAIEAFTDARSAGTWAPAFELRALSGAAWALQQSGDINPALELLQQARDVAEGPQFSDVDRADVLFRIGVCRYKLSSVGTAVALFDEALVLAERSGLPGSASGRHPGLALAMSPAAARLCRGSRGRRARARARTGPRRSARDREHVLPGVAHRPTSGPLGPSRSYAQRAKDLYQELNDERNVGRLLLALGGLTLLLGDEDKAVEHLKASFSQALESDSPPDAAQALQGLARVHLNRGEYDQADELARKGLALLEGREDYLHEVCPSQLVLGRALMERGRLDEAGDCFRKADAAAEQLSSISHRTEAWVALGDLAARRGDDRESARLYRNAAEALQEIRF